MSRGTSAFELFLYAAIIMETALAAFVYKVVFTEAGVAALNVSLTVIYFGFLAWAIVQLNILHRRRKIQEVSEPDGQPHAVRQTMAVMGGSADERRILGLSAGQAVVIFIVFAAAIASFSWIFSTLHPSG